MPCHDAGDRGKELVILYCYFMLYEKKMMRKQKGYRRLQAHKLHFSAIPGMCNLIENHTLQWMNSVHGYEAADRLQRYSSQSACVPKTDPAENNPAACRLPAAQ